MPPSEPLDAVELETVKIGDGVNFPKSGATVRIHYSAKLPDGTLFDSTRNRGRAYEFQVGANQVIRGLDDSIVRMSKGQIARLRIPPAYAYGEHGYPPVVPPNTTLFYEVELLVFTSPTS
ncbi:FKBP-type peptidyl-prolyl cis-trans isomerase [Achlya hypogyna]|uniref:peptidylprolyl isomerase n=1 Tax=Achlya hypogyna TaxID=1202772 RepID=A0A1V9YC13_ACHHY|nr:FKBP-type peptidyl-prolyl cis-trans isomerase [Achlya hypogyna]